MIRPLMCAALALFLAGGMAAAQDMPSAPDTDGTPAAPVSDNSVKLQEVLAELPPGAPWLSVAKYSMGCFGTTENRAWTSGREKEALGPYAAAFKDELQHAGYKVVTATDDLFASEPATADYEVAALITRERIKGCVADQSFFTNKGDSKGTAAMQIEWQVWSPIRKQVVAKVTTQGKATLDRLTSGGLQQMAVRAFAVNVRALVQDAAFRTAITAPRATAKDLEPSGQQSPISLSGSLKARPRKIADATGDVVTVLSSLGSGSGVLVSDDGYMLTNAHVVGDDKQVRVRWPDGIETIASVERVAKTRDIAIIKTSARDRSPLAIKRGPVTPGQRVYAIGSPTGKKFEGTVTSGVISADRTINGLRYIQSDVSISPGSSGGALLDESGSVIGITVAFYLNEDRPAGLNMFIPIGDAVDFLSLEQK